MTQAPPDEWGRPGLHEDLRDLGERIGVERGGRLAPPRSGKRRRDEVPPNVVSVGALEAGHVKPAMARFHWPSGRTEHPPE